MKIRSAANLFAAACVAAASAAHAMPLSERSSIALFAGENLSTPGAWREPSNNVAEGGSTYYDRMAFDDAYHHDYTAGAEYDYRVDSHLAAFARAAWSQLDGQTRKIGETFLDAAAPSPINASFGDAKTNELDAGARYTFTTGDKWRPFVGASLGARHMSSTSAEVEGTRVALGKADTVFEQRLETGVQYSPAHNFDLRLTAAATHIDASAGSDDANLGLLGLDPSSSGVRAHWSYPAEVGAVWHF